MRFSRLTLLLLTALLSSAASAATLAPVDSSRWSDEYDDYFRKYAKRYFGPHFNWHWFKAQGIVESRLRPKVRSPVGAVGVMQIMPTTFTEIQQRNPHYVDIESPRWNIAAGIYYDRYLYRHRVWDALTDENQLMLAFAGYNAGLGGALRAFRRAPKGSTTWAEMSPYAPRETQGYVAQIRSLVSFGQRRTPRQRGAAGLIALADE